jgi:hypothetical protein
VRDGFFVLGKAQIDEQLFKSCDVGDVAEAPLEGLCPKTLPTPRL